MPSSPPGPTGPADRTGRTGRTGPAGTGTTRRQTGATAPRRDRRPAVAAAQPALDPLPRPLPPRAGARRVPARGPRPAGRRLLAGGDRGAVHAPPRHLRPDTDRRDAQPVHDLHVAGVARPAGRRDRGGRHRPRERRAPPPRPAPTASPTTTSTPGGSWRAPAGTASSCPGPAPWPTRAARPTGRGWRPWRRCGPW